MRRRVYVETNFIISVANANHEANDKILAAAGEGLFELALPQICIDEALSASVKDRERMQRHLSPLRPEVREYGRARQSPSSRAASSRLQSAILAIEKADRERLARLRNVLSRLVKTARLLPAALPDVSLDDDLSRDPFDAIIAGAIAAENRAFGCPSPFLSANNDFDEESLRDTLEASGVRRVRHPEELLAMLRGQKSDGAEWQ
jgi:hypothetical protein